MSLLRSSIRIALRALRVNKMRSALTMLGVIIGVGAVIAMVAVGSGATERIEQQIASIGSNVIVVLSGSITTSGIRLGSGFAATLTEDDAKAIVTECPSVAAAAPVSRGGAQIVYGNSNWATSVQGTTPDYLAIRDLRIASGSAFAQQDVDAAAKVVLVGKTVAGNLFAGVDPVGQIIRIKKVPFTVVGVLESKGQSPTGQDQDDLVIIPISTAKKKVLGANLANAASVGSILVQARGSNTMASAQEEMHALLRQRHRLQAAQDDDFSTRDLSEVFQAQETSANVMAILLASIASVSLVVGGIGIMNIMLVSVTERTREIGLRQAVGAKTRNILTQFLVEAITLSTLGGIAGIALGIAVSTLISRIAGWTVHIGLLPVAVAFVFSGLVGIAFGYYPARKAAYLDPIEALRYE